MQAPRRHLGTLKTGHLAVEANFCEILVPLSKRRHHIDEYVVSATAHPAVLSRVQLPPTVLMNFAREYSLNAKGAPALFDTLLVLQRRLSLFVQGQQVFVARCL